MDMIFNPGIDYADVVEIDKGLYVGRLKSHQPAAVGIVRADGIGPEPVKHFIISPEQAYKIALGLLGLAGPQTVESINGKTCPNCGRGVMAYKYEDYIHKFFECNDCRCILSEKRS